MKAICLISSNDQASSKHASSVALENDFTLVVLTAKEFPKFEKPFFTDTLDGKKCLFYITDAQLLKQDASEKLFKMISESPHRFILSGNAETPWYIKMRCLTQNMDNSVDVLTQQLKALLTEPNRVLVREFLHDADLVHLFHILKYGAWRNPESLGAMIEISQNLYKINRSYLLSMLSWILPPKPFAFAFKKQANFTEASIMKKIEKLKPNSNKVEVADMYLMMKSCKDSISGLELSDEEKSFMGIEEKQVENQAVFCRTIEEFF